MPCRVHGQWLAGRHAQPQAAPRGMTNLGSTRTSKFRHILPNFALTENKKPRLTQLNVLIRAKAILFFQY